MAFYGAQRLKEQDQWGVICPPHNMLETDPGMPQYSDGNAFLSEEFNLWVRNLKIEWVISLFLDGSVTFLRTIWCGHILSECLLCVCLVGFGVLGARDEAASGPNTVLVLCTLCSVMWFLWEMWRWVRKEWVLASATSFGFTQALSLCIT